MLKNVVTLWFKDKTFYVTTSLSLKLAKWHILFLMIHSLHRTSQKSSMFSLLEN